MKLLSRKTRFVLGSSGVFLGWLGIGLGIMNIILDSIYLVYTAIGIGVTGVILILIPLIVMLKTPLSDLERQRKDEPGY